LAATWCDIQDVLGRLGDAQNAKGYDDTSVTDKIGDAEDYLRPYFTGALDTAEVAGWTSKSLTPRAVTRLVAMLAGPISCRTLVARASRTNCPRPVPFGARFVWL